MDSIENKIHDTDFEITMLTSLLKNLTKKQGIESYELVMLESGFTGEQFGQLMIPFSLVTLGKENKLPSFEEFRNHFYQIGKFEMKNKDELNERVDSFLRGLIASEYYTEFAKTILSSKESNN